MAGEDPDLKATFGGLIANIALAFLASAVVSYALRMFGVGEEIAFGANTVVFFTIIYADPFALWRENVPRRRALVKLGVGAAMGLVVAGLISAIPDTIGVTDTGATDAPGAQGALDTDDDEKSMMSVIWIMLPILLILPLFFMAPFLETIATRKEKPTADDIGISLVFPIYMLATMVLNLAIPGALWAIGANFLVAGLVFVASILLVVLEVWQADPEDMVDTDMQTWGPRPDTALDAFAGLKRALKNSVASGLFIGSTIYISLLVATPFLDAGGSDDGLAFITGFLKMTGAMLASFLLLVVVALMILVTAVLTLMRLKGLDPLSTSALAQQCSSRLFTGGIHWVRPDLPDD